MDRAALATAMNKLVYQGTPLAPDGGMCFARAVEKSGMSNAAIMYVEKTRSINMMALGASMKTAVGQKDATIWLSDSLRGQLDQCVDAQLHGVKKSRPGGRRSSSGTNRTSSPNTDHPVITKPRKPDLTPVYKISHTTEIVTPDQLKPGLIAMFTSFGNPAQAALIRTSAGCMSNVIINAGFTQRTLRFIAGGARIGVGSVEEYLPSSQDAITWNSPTFSAKLSACVQD